MQHNCQLLGSNGQTVANSLQHSTQVKGHTLATAVHRRRHAHQAGSSASGHLQHSTASASSSLACLIEHLSAATTVTHLRKMKMACHTILCNSPGTSWTNLVLSNNSLHLLSYTCFRLATPELRCRLRRAWLIHVCQDHTLAQSQKPTHQLSGWLRAVAFPTRGFGNPSVPPSLVVWVNCCSFWQTHKAQPKSHSLPTRPPSSVLQIKMFCGFTSLCTMF